jgi:hypothetical protein
MEVDPTRSIPATSAGRGFAEEVAEMVTGLAGPLTFADFRVTYDDAGDAKFSVGARKGGAPSYESGPTTIEIFETFQDEFPNVEQLPIAAPGMAPSYRFISPSAGALSTFNDPDNHHGKSSEFFVKEPKGPWVPEWRWDIGRGSANMKRTISHAHVSEAEMCAEFIIAYGNEQTIDGFYELLGRTVYFELRIFNKILTAELRPLKYSETESTPSGYKRVRDGRTKFPSDWIPAKKEAFEKAAAAHDRYRAAEMEHVRRLAKLWIDVKAVRGVA